MIEEDFSALLATFPETNFAFAYGSGAIEQGGYSYDKNLPASSLPMLDLIFVVDDAKEWHKKNNVMNPTHYTTIFPLNWSKMIEYTQNLGGGIWYNTMLPIGIGKTPSRLMKYGVISSDYLIKDLTSWNALYAAGRLHKPIRIIKNSRDNKIEKAIEMNRQSALAVSILINSNKNNNISYDTNNNIMTNNTNNHNNNVSSNNGSTFNELDLFMGIAGISYIGDPRMDVGGENPFKVRNLVQPVMSTYRSIYGSITDAFLQSQLLHKVDYDDSSYSSSSNSSSDSNDKSNNHNNHNYNKAGDGTMVPVSRYRVDTHGDTFWSLVQKLPSAFVEKIRSKVLVRDPGAWTSSTRGMEGVDKVTDVMESPFICSSSSSSSSSSLLSERDLGDIDIGRGPSSSEFLGLSTIARRKREQIFRSELFGRLKSVVARSSTIQSVKAPLTVGVSKCVHYVGIKVMKSAKARIASWRFSSNTSNNDNTTTTNTNFDSNSNSNSNLRDMSLTTATIRCGNKSKLNRSSSSSVASSSSSLSSSSSVASSVASVAATSTGARYNYSINNKSSVSGRGTTGSNRSLSYSSTASTAGHMIDKLANTDTGTSINASSRDRRGGILAQRVLRFAKRIKK